jgi:TRAP-type C4-dicarboxylate transport system permease small subunit
VTRPIDATIRLLSAVNAPISRWGRSAAAVLLAVMLAVALAQILSRAVLDHTLDWAEELARMALVWSVLLAAPLGYRSGAQVAISAFETALPPRLLYSTALVLNLLTAWVCGVFLLESFDFVARGFTIVASAVPLQMGWVYTIVPVSLAAMTLVAAECVLRLGRALLDGRFDLLLSGAVPVPTADRDC